VSQNFHSSRGNTAGADFPGRNCRFCRGRVSAEMTDSDLKVGLAFLGFSCIAAFAVLLYMRSKAEEAQRGL